MTEFEFALLLAILFFLAAIIGAEFSDPEHPSRKRKNADR